MLIDTHTHIYSQEFDVDRDEVIAKSFSSGVSHLVLPAVDSQSMELMHQLKDKYPHQIYLMAGLHPTYVKDDFEQELKKLELQLQNHSFCAIGEIGIDLYWDKTLLKQQIEAFKFQIQLAKKYNLPIAIHCREAFDEVFQVLEEENHDTLRGIFHCFTGTKEQALKAISYNLKLGIGGVATFKNGKIDQFLHEIAIDNIVLETDSPYLSPMPYRGKRNESSYLPLIAKKVADIYAIPYENLAEQTTINARELLSI